MNEEEYFKAISMFEQAAAHFEQFAIFLANYHKQLHLAGFTRPEALKLVKELQQFLFSLAFNSQNETEN